MGQFWRVHCHIGHHPGQWQFWYREQCCAVGWPPSEWDGRRHEGWSITEPARGDRDFSTTMRHLRRMVVGDWIVATLPGNRVGRIGRITELAVEDGDWDPIVKPITLDGFGDNGRRILVRWELATGPRDPSKVVLLPPVARFNGGEIRGTVRSIPLEKLAVVREAMNDEANWVSLDAVFNLETALSAYIAVHPHRLEDGMVSHPALDATELTFGDKRRADVILQDRKERPVIVECKQGTPSLEALDQVEHYRSTFIKQWPNYGMPRAIVVHGGSRRVMHEVAEAARARGIELVYFELQVNFAGSTG